MRGSVTITHLMIGDHRKKVVSGFERSTETDPKHLLYFRSANDKISSHLTMHVFDFKESVKKDLLSQDWKIL